MTTYTGNPQHMVRHRTRCRARPTRLIPAHAPVQLKVAVLHVTPGALEQLFPTYRTDKLRPMSVRAPHPTPRRLPCSAARLTRPRLFGDRARQVREGEVMVGNLNRISSLLTLIPVPDGDFDAHIRSTHLSINLRRLGCSGRSAVTLEYPQCVACRLAPAQPIPLRKTPADSRHTDCSRRRCCREARERFLNVFRTSTNIPFDYTVMQLGRLVQLSLHFFNLYRLEEVDGVLCDDTMDALRKYQSHFGVGRSEVRERARRAHMLVPQTSQLAPARLLGSRVAQTSTEDIIAFPRTFAHLFSSVQITRNMLLSLGSLAVRHGRAA